MKIEIDIPDFEGIESRAFFIFAGLQCVAIKSPGKAWHVKTKHCNLCGECCKRFKRDREFPPVTNGRCGFLQDVGNESRCGLGANRPFNCAISNPDFDGCVVSFEKVK